MKLLTQVMGIGVLTFSLSIILSLGSNSLLGVIPLIPSFMLLFFIVFVGIIFDVVGVAATAGSEKPFHAMASNRLPGSKQSIWIVRNADRVATFCSDVVGDIAGTLSGAIGAAIVFRILLIGPRFSETLLTTVLIGIVAAVTVMGKSMGKSLAISRSTEILYISGRLLHVGEQMGIKIAINSKYKPKTKNPNKRSRK